MRSVGMQINGREFAVCEKYRTTDAAVRSVTRRKLRKCQHQCCCDNRDRHAAAGRRQDTSRQQGERRIDLARPRAMAPMPQANTTRQPS